ncbi:MAG: hypothetical protein MUF45_05260 [Spirosomaceae bacterium]|jgi:hypothetical protein|nr:hypothetical protein [Spirosomataceae bacterium]
MYFLTKQTKTLTIIFIILTVYGQNLYAQNSNVQVIDVKNILFKERPMALAGSVHEIASDTSEILYYSFEESRVVPFNKKFVNTEDSKTSAVYVCEGNSVVLTAPDYGENATYSWKGPQGFASYAQQVMIDKVTPFQAGYYNITIKKNGTTTLGKIKLMVKEKPTAIAEGGIFCSGEPIKIAAADAGIGAKYRWTQPPSDFTANAQNVIVENLMVGHYRYYLTVTKGGCKSMDTAHVEIKQVPLAITSSVTIKEGEAAKLTAADAGTGATYSWKGPYLGIVNEQNPTIKGLPVGKYIYILTVVKNGCHSMNVTVVEVEKNEINASNKN